MLSIRYLLDTAYSFGKHPYIGTQLVHIDTEFTCLPEIYGNIQNHVATAYLQFNSTKYGLQKISFYILKILNCEFNIVKFFFSNLLSTKCGVQKISFLYT